MRKILIFPLVLIFTIFNGCNEKIKYVYIKTQCPKLQTFDVNVSKNNHFRLHYKVKEINESGRNSSR